MGYASDVTLPYFLRKDGTVGPLALAHRGFSMNGLENSMAAFRAAVELGNLHLETDVHTTSDGVLLVFHDSSLDRVTDSSGRIAELTAAEVAQARIGGVEPVPTFDELVAAFPDARLNLDVKDWNSVKPMAEAIEKHGIHRRVLVTSFSDRRRRAVLKLLSQPTASSAGSSLTALFVLLGPVLPARLARDLGLDRGNLGEPGSSDLDGRADRQRPNRPSGDAHRVQPEGTRRSGQPGRRDGVRRQALR